MAREKGAQPHACLRRRTRRDGNPDRCGSRDRRADRRFGPGGRRGRAQPRHPRHPEHHDHEVPVDGQHAARAHHQPAGNGDLPRLRHRGPGARGRHTARTGGRYRLLHLDRRGGDRPHPDLGHSPGSGGRLPAGIAVPDLRHPADLPGADPGQERHGPRHPDPVLYRVPQPPPGRRRRHYHGSRPAHRSRLQHPVEVLDRRGRRPLPGRRAHRTAVRGPDGHRRLDEHHLQGRYIAVRRLAPVCPLLGHPARVQRRRHRRGPGPHDPPVA